MPNARRYPGRSRGFALTGPTGFDRLAAGSLGLEVRMRKWLTVCVYVNAIVIIGLCLYVFVLPAGMVIRSLHDPGLDGDAVPHSVWGWHRALSPKYAKWARGRVASGAAGRLTTRDIAQTEWPLFGSVFYLWATESLQTAFDQNPKAAPSAPKVYARDAIEAAAALVADPNHAGWVRQHWGDKYLEKENLFYRMLLISALTSYQKLLDDTRYEDFLRSQVESLAAEMDASPYGLLDDYPGQCYPVDIVPAIAAIRRADAVLGTDHSQFAARAIRGFQDTRLDSHTGLPAYVVSSRTGAAVDSARGVGLSFMLIWAPQLWPETARLWYDKYEQQFWQQGRWLAGFREYPEGIDVGWFAMNDVDAGPVVAGYGMAACAFGAGAVRAMGDGDRAYPLGAEAMLAAWPLPNGTLLVPRLLSNFSDAPYLGEAATLFALTRRPAVPVRRDAPLSAPAGVYLGISVLLTVGLGEIAASLWVVRRWRRDTRRTVPLPQLQCVMWLALFLAAGAAWLASAGWLGLVLLLMAQVLPHSARRRNVEAETDEPRQSVAQETR
jgi:hypothetical protein